NVHHLHGDRCDIESIISPSQEWNAVIDMNAMTQADAQTAARAIRGVTGRVVVISSGDVYRRYDLLRRVDIGPAEETPLVENAPLRSHHFPYRGHHELGRQYHDYEKILVEHAYGESGLPLAVLRLAMVYGPGDPQNRVQAYVTKIRS